VTFDGGTPSVPTSSRPDLFTTGNRYPRLAVLGVSERAETPKT
jgi:hypothetical protein